MTVLVVGASGATGRLLVKQLLEKGQSVKAVVRSPERFREIMGNTDHANLTVVGAKLLDLSDSEMVELVSGCHAVASCLGHTLSFKGIYGQPRRLVTDATRRLCQAVKANSADSHVKFVLMNTTGNRNRDLDEPISFAQKIVIGLIRVLIPPHVDNERAADFLRTEIGQDDQAIEWVVVRPDTLTNQDAVTEYELHASPTRSAIFNPGVTSRIHVGEFMAELIANDETWNRWKGQMPVIYDKVSS